MNLTPREQQVAETLARTGGRNVDLARELNLSPKTVKQHLSSAMQKVGARNRVQLVVSIIRGEE